MIAPSPVRATRRFGWLVVLAVALLARLTAPEGWMPVVNAAGAIEITVCNGMAPGDAMVLSADGKLSHKAPAKGQSGDHPCVFAGVGVAGAPPVVAALGAPSRTDIDAPGIARITIAPGHGLAAPPPPATGPPTLT